MRSKADAAFLTRIGQQIRSIREAKGLSQESLALKSGIDRTYISSVERGRRNIAVINLRRIAVTLDVSPCAILDPRGR